MFENLGETGKQEILDLKSSSKQIFDVGCPWKVDSAIHREDYYL